MCELEYCETLVDNDEDINKYIDNALDTHDCIKIKMLIYDLLRNNNKTKIEELMVNYPAICYIDNFMFNVCENITMIKILLDILHKLKQFGSKKYITIDDICNTYLKIV